MRLLRFVRIATMCLHVFPLECQYFQARERKAYNHYRIVNDPNQVLPDEITQDNLFGWMNLKNTVRFKLWTRWERWYKCFRSLLMDIIHGFSSVNYGIGTKASIVWMNPAAMSFSYSKSTWMWSVDVVVIAKSQSILDIGTNIIGREPCLLLHSFMQNYANLLVNVPWHSSLKLFQLLAWHAIAWKPFASHLFWWQVETWLQAYRFYRMK